MNVQKARTKVAKALLRDKETAFEQLDLTGATKVPHWMTRAYRNNRYTVMINDNTLTTAGPAIRAMVQSHTNLPIHGHWAELQRIKNEIFGPETVAVEYYPAESKLIDQHNIYWIWIFPAGILPIPL